MIRLADFDCLPTETNLNHKHVKIKCIKSKAKTKI